eukprot:7713775-Pyramimonas_sp.AAC.1
MRLYSYSPSGVAVWRVAENGMASAPSVQPFSRVAMRCAEKPFICSRPMRCHAMSTFDDRAHPKDFKHIPTDPRQFLRTHEGLDHWKA